MIGENSEYKFNQKEFTILGLISLTFIIVLLLSSSNYKHLTKARIEIINLKKDITILKKQLKAITDTQSDSLYKLFKIERTCNIDFNKQTKRFSIAHLDSIKKYCLEYNVPERIAFRVVEHESHFDSSALGIHDDKSYFQITPVYWVYYKCDSISEDLYGLMEIGIKGLADLKIRYKTWERALSVYNSGKPNNNVSYKYVNSILK